MQTVIDQKPSITFLERPGLPPLAYEYTENGGQGKGRPLLMFCGGYRSDMTGTKASDLARRCAARGQPFLRFDYSGHGSSGGAFEDGTIGGWARDAADLLDHVARFPAVVAGSSMGGWIALLLAQSHTDRICGIVGIAAAPDFTESMFRERLSEAEQRRLLTEGRLEMAAGPGEAPYVVTREFYEEARNNLVLNRPRTLELPVRLVQGMQDPDVPWETAARIQKNYRGSSVDIVFIEDGDHRLSRPEDLEIIDREIRVLSGI